jgi:hypothetical protein
MREELIKYNTAKLAKNKGFNWEVTATFNTMLKDNSIPSINTSLTNWNLNDEIHKRYVSAPTQGLLQKWLREEHNLFVYVEPTSLGDNAPFIKDSWGKVYYDPWKNNNKGISWDYEEALEFALLKALRLIK